MQRNNYGFILLVTFLLACSAYVSPAQIKMEVAPDGFLFLDGRDSVCFYRKATKPLNDSSLRSNYISMLFDLDGKRLTSESPDESPDRQGVFWAWPQILIDGQVVSNGLDLQNFQIQTDNLEFMKMNDQGVLNVTALWRSPLWENGAKAYLRENTKIVIYPRTGNYRRIDLSVKLKSLTDRLSLGDSASESISSGGFFLGLNNLENFVFSGAGDDVLQPEEPAEMGDFVNASRASSTGGGRGGVIVWSSHENPNSGGWYLSRTQKFLNAVMPGSSGCQIPFDEPLQLKYSLIIYKGSMNIRQIRNALK